MADTISELKLGNGTSILIFANIASALPTSVGAALTQAADKDSSTLGIYALAWFLTTLGIVYVQDAERQIPITYASRYRAGALQQQAYLPFKVGEGGLAERQAGGICRAAPRWPPAEKDESEGCCCCCCSGAVKLAADVLLLLVTTVLCLSCQPQLPAASTTTCFCYPSTPALSLPALTRRSTPPA